MNELPKNPKLRSCFHQSFEQCAIQAGKEDDLDICGVLIKREITCRSKIWTSFYNILNI